MSRSILNVKLLFCHYGSINVLRSLIKRGFWRRYLGRNSRLINKSMLINRVARILGETSLGSLGLESNVGLLVHLQKLIMDEKINEEAEEGAKKGENISTRHNTLVQDGNVRLQRGRGGGNR